MRWRGVSHVEFAVLDYDDSIESYDAMFGWSGFSSFSSMDMEVPVDLLLHAILGARVGAESAVTAPGLAVLPRHPRVREGAARPGPHGAGRDTAGDAEAAGAALGAAREGPNRGADHEGNRFVKPLSLNEKLYYRDARHIAQRCAGRVISA